MEIGDFEFKKERKLGEFIQDFINLIKIIGGHLVAVMLRLLLIPICIIVLVVYYSTTQQNSTMKINDVDFGYFIQYLLWALLLVLIVGLVGFGLAIEYFIQLRDRRNLDFGSRDVLRAYVKNLGKYFKFLLSAILVSFIIAIPVAIVAVLSMLIPLVGSFAVGILITMVTLWYFVSLLLYREGYSDSFGAMSLAFRILKRKIFSYGVAVYVIHFIFQSLLMLTALVPTVVLFVVLYSSGYSMVTFDTFYGRLLLSLGGSIITVVTLLYYCLSVFSYGIVYETAKELNFGESIFDRIKTIGRREKS